MTEFTCLKCLRSPPIVEPSDESQRGDRREPICQSCSDLPTAGFHPPVGPREEYRDLEQAIISYRDAADRDATVDRAIAAIRWANRRDRFVESHNLSGPAETACLARLIGGHDECPHELFDDDDDPHAPAHSPPVDDHATLWLDEDGDPALYSMHIYQGDLEHDFGDGPDNRWFDLVDFSRHHGLQIGVRDSWYNPRSCQQIVFYPPEGY